MVFSRVIFRREIRGGRTVLWTWCWLFGSSWTIPLSYFSTLHVQNRQKEGIKIVKTLECLSFLYSIKIPQDLGVSLIFVLKLANEVTQLLGCNYLIAGI